MNKIQRFFLKLIAEKTVVQGFFHHIRIKKYYKTLILAARKEFSEDNDTSLASFLRDLHEETLQETLKHSTGAYPKTK